MSTSRFLLWKETEPDCYLPQEFDRSDYFKRKAELAMLSRDGISAFITTANSCHYRASNLEFQHRFKQRLAKACLKQRNMPELPVVGGLDF